MPPPLGRGYGAAPEGIVAVLLSLMFACSSEEGPVAPKVTGAPPDVVVVTMDTMRADRIGAYGYAQARTDTIDKLAAEGLRFEQAISPLPLTIPAHATMFTGLFPFHHNIRSNGDNVLASTFTTLAERLRDEGWVTGASVAAFVTTRQWGFSQGFSAYFDQMPEDGEKNYWHTERDGQAVVDDALNWVASQPADKPLFLWVHLYDAHFPYVAKGEYTTEMADRPYDAEIAYVDDQIGRLVDAFAQRKVLWALIGDHGEGLGEHHESTHGLYAYQATQHVPWILSGAGVSPGVVKQPVSTADLTPTLLSALGLAIPEGLDGKPQPGSATQPYAESWQLAERYRLAPHRAIVDGNLKLVALPKPELYDIVADPAEKTDLAEQRPDDVARMTAMLDALGAAPPGEGQVELDAETVSQLAALGYVTGGASTGVDPLSLPDPKDHAKLLVGLHRLENMGRQGSNDPAATLALIDELIALKPDAFELRMRRVPVLARLGRVEETKTFMEETAKLFPDKARVWVTLAGMATRQRDFVQAEVYARKAVEVGPKEASAREALVEALFAQKRYPDALALGEQSMKDDPRNYGVAALLGRYYLGQNDFVNAERWLRVAVSGPNPRRAARVGLAMLGIAAGAREDAYKLLEAEIADYPGNGMARRILSRMYAEDQRWLDQKAHAAWLARALPKEPDARRGLAQCLFNLDDYPGARVELDAALALAPDDPDVLLLHANLLAKEGKRDEGAKVYEKAKALHEKRVAETEAKAAAAAKAAPKAGTKGAATKGATAPKALQKGAAAPAGAAVTGGAK